LAPPVARAAAFGRQLVGLTVGSLETWLALRWLGHPLSFEGPFAGYDPRLLRPNTLPRLARFAMRFMGALKSGTRIS